MMQRVDRGVWAIRGSRPSRGVSSRGSIGGSWIKPSGCRALASCFAQFMGVMDV